MNENNNYKKYQSFKIPDRSKAQENGAANIPQKSKNNIQITLNDLFYEIEYDNSPIPGAGKFVLKSLKNLSRLNYLASNLSRIIWTLMA